MANDLEKALEMLVSVLGNKEENEEEYNEISSEEETVLQDEAQPELQGITELFSGSDDKRVNLLSSIKPYMNGKRQEKVDTAINMVRILSVSSSLGLGNLFNFK